MTNDSMNDRPPRDGRQVPSEAARLPEPLPDVWTERDRLRAENERLKDWARRLTDENARLSDMMDSSPNPTVRRLAVEVYQGENGEVRLLGDATALDAVPEGPATLLWVVA